ncbi:polysaccharide deacetylase [Listeria sp. FSL L7-1509]|uniref:Polysaccharide deacetylase n=1 Tax=Listeria immobilis TaxID=2713502 RepID=A0ABR6SSW5_9LIST|nr:polysaccharide deacetylase family protein [Listeria immobilis]MBC1482733.1 polysaccharide deacetylase [Listeria immobilis]MBC1506053.1 polysaccharide deacetylase [Listeria immobilis]MBC1508697.1 polysaccharide deacetylase [Listeria immobilis]MBC6303059.1 polysaccharide deacetylase [Listeria immobilis]MBC6311410.1 polysaccharide deacetylase [Listeria immobilis]
MKKRKTNKRNLLIFFLICLIPICLLSVILVIKSFVFVDNTNASSEYPVKAPPAKQFVTKEITDKLKPKKIDQPVKLDGKTVFLTFDDGPTTYLNEFISILNKAEAPATFFFVGNSLEQMNKETASTLVKSGHSIGLHSYSHDAKLLYRDTNPTFIPEMERLKTAIQNKTGVTTNLIRAPYGSTYLTDSEYQNVKQKGFKMLDWNVDSNDWRYKDNAESVIQSVMTQVKNLEQSNEPLVILFHERKNTLQALPTIIKQLKDKGYRFDAYYEKTPFTEIFKD